MLNYPSSSEVNYVCGLSWRYRSCFFAVGWVVECCDGLVRVVDEVVGSSVGVIASVVGTRGGGVVNNRSTMSQVLALDHQFTDSLQRVACRSHELSSSASVLRTKALGAQFFRARARVLRCSSDGVRAAAGGSFRFAAPGGSFEEPARDDAGVELAHVSRFDAPAQIQRISQKRNKSWVENVKYLGLGVLLAMVAASGFRPRFAPPATAATAEIFIKAKPRRMSPKAKIEEKAIYALDYFFATEPAGKAIVLLAICASMTAIGGYLFCKAGEAEGEDISITESFWSAWTFISDPGTHADVGKFRQRLVAVPLTMGGMLFFALLVGLMSDAVSARVDRLQRGASPVIEENHTIIVGWTPKTIPLVRELTIANKTRGLKRTIVVLGDKDKEEMDEDMRAALPNSERNGSKIVTRSGVPTETEDLRRCSAAMARAIILLSPGGLPSHEADSLVLHSALVMAYLSELKADIVVELAELDNVNLLKQVLSSLMNSPVKALPGTLKSSPLVSSEPTMLLHAGERVQKMVPVATGDFVMRMLVERALQPEIAAVAGELLQFEGSEFRFKRWPELVGKTFGEILYLFDNAIPCGMRKARPDSQGDYTLINPPPETIFEERDRLLVISEDEDSYQPGIPHAPEHAQYVPNMEKHSKQVLKILICGWRNDLQDVLRLIDNNVARGSEVIILSTKDEAAIKELKLGSSLHNVKLNYKYGDPLSMKVLEKLPLEQYDKSIILSDQNHATSSHSSTTTAMYIRHIQVQRGRSDSVIVAELPSSQEGAVQQVQKTWLNDSVQPEQLQAMVLAHLAEDSDVGAVLDEVVSDYGSNMISRSIS
ncbi:hypothetical protein KC19_10G122100 [Ceratodon purpureus]|nr:hypothetical protein KC19_10G122100 [Ceratodon purpureus]